MTSPHELNLLAEKLQRLFPDLDQIIPLRLLGEGFSSLVIETAGGVVFRIGRNPTATAGHVREIRLLPALAEWMSIPIPRPRWYTGPSEAFPFGVIGYPKLPGTPLLPEMLDRDTMAPLAEGVAAFLLALHRFSIEEALALGLPGPGDYRVELERLRAEVLPPLRQALTEAEYELVVRWWEAFLADPDLRNYPPRLQHGDLWYENILVDEAGPAVVGVLDFEHAAVGDPAQDFATLLYLGRPFVAQVIEAYQAGGGLLGENFPHRLEQFWALREFGGVQFSIRYNDSEELEDSIRKLRQGPILKPSTALPTAFALAERASVEDLRRQHDYFLDLLLRRLLDAVPDIVMVLNQQRQIVFANRTLLDLLGLEDDRLVSGLRPGDALGCTHAGSTEGGCGTTEFCKTCGAAQVIVTSLQQQEAVEECRIIRKDGESLDLRVWGKPLSLENENFSIFSVKDISHEKRRQVLERIFFHDLMNTAGGLHGFAGLLAKTTPAELDQIKASISTLADRLVGEIQAQQELLAAENGELLVRPAPIDSLKFSQELLLLYRNHPAASDRQLLLAPTSQAIEFVSDVALLGRVIGNLIKNALEASRPGETVTLACATSGDFVEFRVHNPAFMPESIQLQIFQRSFSTRGAGRGLGTYSIRLLSERYLRGRVSFTSTPATGTTFTARYPRILER